MPDPKWVGNTAMIILCSFTVIFVKGKQDSLFDHWHQRQRWMINYCSSTLAFWDNFCWSPNLQEFGEDVSFWGNNVHSSPDWGYTESKNSASCWVSCLYSHICPSTNLYYCFILFLQVLYIQEVPFKMQIK